MQEGAQWSAIRVSRLVHALCKGRRWVARREAALLPCLGGAPGVEGSDVEDRDRIEAIRKMRQGERPMTFKEIADVLGCKPQEVAKLARMAGPEAKPEGVSSEPKSPAKPDGSRMDPEYLRLIEEDERARAAAKSKIEAERQAANLEKATKVGEEAAKKSWKITLGCFAAIGILAVLGMIFNTGDEDWQNQYYLADYYAEQAQSYYAVGEDGLAREAMDKSREHRRQGDRIKERAGGW